MMAMVRIARPSLADALAANPSAACFDVGLPCPFHFIVAMRWKT
jgi:hypothetical protein